jgi:hypothetical protein
MSLLTELEIWLGLVSTKISRLTALWQRGAGRGARGAGEDGNLMQADGKFYPQISRMTQMGE